MVDTKKPESSKDGLALIVGGLFILALVFAAYNYFNKTSKNEDIKKIQEETVFQNDQKENNNDKTQDKGNLNGEGAKTSNTQGTPNTATVSGTSTTSASTWVANNYNPGEIKAGSYTVKSGDTLWEIAEAAYGNGAEWGKILAANKSSIGMLPNGSQALIVPGQVLVLP